MEIEESAVRQYAYTLRRTSMPKGVQMEDYFEHMSELCRKTMSSQIEHVFELKGGLHMHGIVEIPKDVDLKRFRVRGWHMHMEELYDAAGWRYYMMKEQQIKADNKKIRDELQNKLFPEEDKP